MKSTANESWQPRPKVKSLWFITCAALLAGCAHRPDSFSALPGTGPITRDTAIIIAEQVVRDRESWKRLDSAVYSQAGGWRVWVCPVPIRGHGPMARVLLDRD